MLCMLCLCQPWAVLCHRSALDLPSVRSAIGILLPPRNRLQVSELVELVELSSWSSWGSWSPRNLELVELLPAVGCALLIALHRPS